MTDLNIPARTVKRLLRGSGWMIPVLMLCSPGLMGQKVPEKEKPKKSSWFEVSVSGLGGRYYETVCAVSSSGYEGVHLVPLVDQSTQFYEGAVGFSYTVKNDRRNRITIGATLFLGDEVPQQTYISSGGGPVYGISPNFSFNLRAFGLTAGFMLGQTKIPIPVPDRKLEAGTIVSKQYAWTKFTPALGVRVGPEDIVFAEAMFPAFFPSCTAYPAVRAGLGTGLGKTNGTKIAAGYAQGVYAEGVVPVLNTFLIKGLLATNLKSGRENRTMLSLGVSYRFNYKEVELSKKRAMPRPIPARVSKMTDRDHNTYRVMLFGSRMISLSDLQVTHFRNGDPLPDTVPGKAQPGQYSWTTVADARGLCPTGWHVPSATEWNSLVTSINRAEGSGQDILEKFSGDGKSQQWWSSTSIDESTAQSFYLNSKTKVMMLTAAPKTTLLPVRCIK